MTTRERDVDATLEIVEAVEGGEIAVSPSIPESSPGPREAKARRLFGKALVALQNRVWENARAKLRAEYDAIRKADAAIMEAAKHLPAGARQAIVEARTSLAKPLLQLRLRVDKWSRQDHDTAPEK